MALRIVNVRGFSIRAALDINNKVQGFYVCSREHTDSGETILNHPVHFDFFIDAARYVAFQRYPDDEMTATQFMLFLTDDIYMEGEEW